ncbi:hypothetical protein FIBSPDRAFT_896378 [Athelia psychrophila]|uniref:Uncharacterized protein n=1 Tax=Athelia psychrophila TaxID=1759441 RepID=A0A166DEL6_9AGAM|nr:hypothetical protein FIBSPDRAFT_896378 [Fibularhizoctonia sp. CBS 109695]
MYMEPYKNRKGTFSRSALSLAAISGPRVLLSFPEPRAASTRSSGTLTIERYSYRRSAASHAATRTSVLYAKTPAPSKVRFCHAYGVMGYEGGWTLRRVAALAGKALQGVREAHARPVPVLPLPRAAVLPPLDPETRPVGYGAPALTPGALPPHPPAQIVHREVHY